MQEYPYDVQTKYVATLDFYLVLYCFSRNVSDDLDKTSMSKMAQTNKESKKHCTHRLTDLKMRRVETINLLFQKIYAMLSV